MILWDVTGFRTCFLSNRKQEKNESEVPKELVTFLKYVKADLAGSEEAFDDSYVEQLQNFIRKIKGSREMEERFMIFEEMLKEEREEGREEGRSVLKETLLLCLQSFGDIPDEVLEQIQPQQDMEVLKNWMQTAFSVKDVGRVCTEDVR